MKHRSRLPYALFCIFFLGATAQAAEPITSGFEVNITIEGTCKVLTTTNIDFGTQTPIPGTDKQPVQYDQTGSIGVQCTKGLDFHVGLDGGSTGDVTKRAMRNADNVQIPYTLSHIGPGGANWGNTDPNWFTGTGKGLGPDYAVAIPVYARATLLGNEPAGKYQDAVTATLTF